MTNLREVRAGHHVVMLVANDVTGDSRVQKTARSAAAAGYEVTVIGRSMEKTGSKEWIGGARIRRVPVPLYFKKHGYGAKGGNRSAKRTAANSRHARSRQRIAELRGRMESHGPLLRRVSRPYRALLWWRIKRLQRGLRSDAGRDRVPRFRRVDWREELPVLLDFELAFAPVLEKDRPALIHAHDISTLAIAERATVVARAAGRDVKLVYDAHEYIAGVPAISERRRQAYVALEEQHIATADAVVTVAPDIADQLQRRYRLPCPPTLVLNAPEAGAFDPSSRLSIRDAAGVSPDAPLVVYSGTVKPERGLETLIRALPTLADVHCVIVARSRSHPEVVRVLSLASELGCEDRLHLVGYVDPADVPTFLRSADVGIHPLLPSGNADRALPNKLFEYLHACIPVAVSDLPALGSFVRRTGVGEVFTPGDVGDLARAVRKVLADRPAYRTALTDPQLRSEYSWERQSERLIAIYDDLLLATESQTVGDSAAIDRSANVLLGPVESSYASAAVNLLADHGAQVRAFAHEHRNDFQGNVVVVPPEDWQSHDWQLEWANQVADSHTHVICLGLSPVFGGLNGGSLLEDLQFLGERGVRPAVVLSSLAAVGDNGSEGSREWIAEIVKAGGSIFAASPEVCKRLPEATWLPYALDPTRWDDGRPLFSRPGVNVVAPADTDDLAGDLLGHQLDQMVGVNVHRAQPHSDEWRAAVLDADVVLGVGSEAEHEYVAVCGMAAGRLVVAITPGTGGRTDDPKRPMLFVDCHGLEELLAEVQRDAVPFIAVAAEGPDFVRRWHDGAETMRRLAGFLS